MQDHRGVYYYPNPAEKTTRMYVRLSPSTPNVIEFRLYSSENPDIWERHEWIPREVVEAAAKQYTNPERDPLALYDESVARALLGIKAH